MPICNSNCAGSLVSATGRLAIAALALLLSNAAPALPMVDADWGSSFVFESSGGLSNPLLQVAFNPQPEPPSPGIVSYATMPGAPDGYPPDPIITHSGDYTDGVTPFRVLFSIGDSGPLRILDASVDGGPSDNVLNFDVLDATGAAAFLVSLTFETTSGGSVLDWVAFNPQPEPPNPGANFGADFTFSNFSDVSLTVHVKDAAGTVLTLRAVPEPTGLALLGLATVLLAGRARNGRQSRG